MVPEQFSFETEKIILKELGDSASLYVEVLSFTRLYDEIGRKIGGIAGTFLRDSDKIVFMNKTLNTVAEDLKLWAKYRSSVNFAKTLLDTIGEFKINAVTPEDLRNTAETIDSQNLKYKLLDLALIYESYDLLLGERFIDPADTLTKTYEFLKSYKYFEGKTVFLDAFKGFTGQQYKIIERIFAQAEDVIISLTNDPNIKGEYCVYANIRKAVEKIEEIAKSRNVKVAKPIILSTDFYASKTISYVERVLAGESFSDKIDGQDLLICKAPTIYDEAQFAASTIRKLVRTENYRYKDFVIIARDSEKYALAVENACRKNAVNLFYDRKIPLSAFPFSVAVKWAFDAVNFSTEAIFGFHKTGLGTLDSDQIARLENYTFIWGIKGKMWEKEWDMDPRGLTADEDTTGETIKELAEINHLRAIAISPILKFKQNLGNNAKSMSSAIFGLLTDCSISEKLNNMCREFAEINGYYSDAIKSAYDEYMKILDSMVMCFSDATISKKEFCDALNLAVSLDSVGVIPQTLDEVIFGSADRIRPSRPKIAFILGANQGEFPKNIANNGIFGLTERKKLVKSGINISDNAIEASIDESYLVYCNLCCPSHKLYISYSENTLLGETKEPSAFIARLNNTINCDNLSFPTDIIYPETVASAFSDYCRVLKSNPSNALAIKNALIGSSMERNIKALGEGSVKKEEQLSVDTAKKLYGNDIYMSATKLDTFNHCHFSFFCRYGLRAEKLRSADFNVLQRGTIVHYCLEKIISQYKKGIADLDNATFDQLCDGYIIEYLNMVCGFDSIRNDKTEFLISRISRSLKEVVHSIRDEMKQSDFNPIACELKIGKDGEIPAIHFPFDRGDIILNGSIDRVDSYNGYIRIIDYKTGSKSFKLPDILFGLNLQMLIYLYSIVRANGIKNAKPAGILYKPAKRDLNESGLSMNGLLPANAELIRAMDKKGEGEFVPKLKIKKDGSVSKASDSFIDPEDFDVIFDYIEKIMKTTGNAISCGDISVTPINSREADACKYCDYSFVCGIEDSEVKRVEKIRNADVINAIKEDNNAD